MQDEPEKVPEVETPNLEQAHPGDLPEEAEIKEVPEEERAQPPSFWTRAFRWLLGLAIIFLLGAAAVIFLLYIPARERINELRGTVCQHESELAAADENRVELEAEIERLQGLQTRNDELEAQIDQANLHVALLSVRTDVATARLALLQEDPARAKAALSQSGETLERIAELVEPEQQEMVSNLQERLDLALTGIDEDPYAAQNDLDVLSNNLLQLENTLFASR